MDGFYPIFTRMSIEGYPCVGPGLFVMEDSLPGMSVFSAIAFFWMQVILCLFAPVHADGTLLDTGAEKNKVQMKKNPGEKFHDFFNDDVDYILLNMNKDLEKWSYRREMAGHWDVGQDGLYDVPTDDEQTDYVKRQAMRFFDKRLVKLFRTADRGTPFYYAGQVEKAVNFKGDVEVGEKLKFKMNIMALEQKGVLSVKGLYFDNKFEFNKMFSSDRNVNARIFKDWKKAGSYAEILFDVNDQAWEAVFEKRLPGHMSLRFKTYQPVNVSPLKKESEKVIGLHFLYM